MKEAFFTEAARRGVLFHPNHCWFVSLAHTDEDVAETLDAARKSMKRAKRRAAQRPLISLM
jgi:glutamate-1-semialdehyde 2,1-aminomutase